MASTIGKVRAVFTASTSGLTSGVNAAAASMRRMENAVAGLRGPMSGLLAINAASFFGSVTSSALGYARSLAGLVVSTTDAVSAQNDLAGRLGVTYGELAGLSYAGSLVGVSMETIGAAMTRAQVAFANAANGSRTAVAAFDAIGLSAAELNGMSAEQQFEAIAQAISQLPTEAERAAAAVRIFGRAGAQLLPLFNQGAAGIQEARAEAERFGLTLTDAQSGNIDAMGDSFDRAKAAITGVISQVVAYLSPAIKAVSDTFSNLIGSVGGANIGQTIGEGILQGARFFATIVDYFIAEGTQIWEYASQIGGQWNAVWDAASRAASLLSGVGRFFQGALLTVVVAFSGIGQAILTAVRSAAASLGFDTSGLDVALASLQGFNQQLSRDIDASFNAAGENFSAAFADTDQFAAAGEAIAGPATQAIDDAIAQAQAAAAAVTEAKPQQVDIQQTVTVDARQAIQGIESRSAEGIKEMFRIMRGDTGDQTQERIALGIERIADNTEDMGFDVEVVDLAPAAGG